MGRSPERRIIVKHTFLEVVEKEDRPALRGRFFTDSALEAPSYGTVEVHRGESDVDGDNNINTLPAAVPMTEEAAAEEAQEFITAERPGPASGAGAQVTRERPAMTEMRRDLAKARTHVKIDLQSAVSAPLKIDLQSAVCAPVGMPTVPEASLAKRDVPLMQRAPVTTGMPCGSTFPVPPVHMDAARSPSASSAAVMQQQLWMIAAAARLQESGTLPRAKQPGPQQQHGHAMPAAAGMPQPAPVARKLMLASRTTVHNEHDKGQGTSMGSRAQMSEAALAERGSAGGKRSSGGKSKASPAVHGASSVEVATDPPLTTVMLRNLPNRYTRAMLLDMLDEDFAGRYDFVYLPIDFKTHNGLGYAFVDLNSPEDAKAFRSHFEGFSRWCLQSDKICTVSWSHPAQQGLSAHVERYRNSPVMHSTVCDEWKPAVFSGGVRVPFPSPTRKLRVPHVRLVPQGESVMERGAAGAG